MSNEIQTVLKFGGAALADGPGVRRVVSIIADRLSANPVVVVSAHSGVTAQLESLAQGAVSGPVDLARVRVRHRSLCSQLGLESELLNRFWIELSHLLSGITQRGVLSEHDRDAVLSIGERVSSRIVAMSLRAQGVFATPVDSFDLGLVAEKGSGEVEPCVESGPRVRDSLSRVPGVPVVTGFLARTDSGLVTTLGPNGSDWTASWLAEAISAHELIYWKTVPGFMTADPCLIPGAKVIERLSWQDAIELTRLGAGVLHPRAIEPARRGGVCVSVRSVTDETSPGTQLEEGASSEGAVGLATGFEDELSTRIAVVGSRGTWERAVHCLENRSVLYRKHPFEAACITVSKDDFMRAMTLLHEELFEGSPVVQASDHEA